MMQNWVQAHYMLYFGLAHSLTLLGYLMQNIQLFEPRHVISNNVAF